MNDPGTDEAIEQADGIVPDRRRDDESEVDEAEEEENHLIPAKWWYANTAIPLIAGTFGPMANAFSICALVENWRVSIPSGGTEEHGIDIKDPKWLIAVNAVSLVLALIANLFLLLNMARRVHFNIAQPITILGFWVASVLLIGLIAKASHDFHAPGVQDQALAQAYYYAIFAAILYQIISYLMFITIYGAWMGHYSKEFKLTVAQRTLMLQTIAFLAYQMLGALVYSHVEGWQFLDALYWSDFTLLTIGIGDTYSPETHLGRGLLFPFAIGGIIIIGLVVGSIRSLVLERGKKKMSARITEKMRRRVLKEVHHAHEQGRKPRMLGLSKSTVKALTQDPKDDEWSELERRKAEFEAMRRVQDMSGRERGYIALAVSSFAFAFLWAIGALVFYYAEANQGWTYYECFYFAYVVLLTIGYGDFEPQSNSGKPFFVFWSLLAIPALTILISNMGDTVVKLIKDATIWVGEITVLPNDEATVASRLKHGIYRATLGMVEPKGHLADEESGGGDSSGARAMPPGLIKLFSSGKGDVNQEGSSKRQDKLNDRLAGDFEAAEEKNEEEAREMGDIPAEDEHHYRHVLISKIREVYTDSNAPTAKKYSYSEWAYFLKLLGEDENNSSYHNRAHHNTADQEPTKDGKGLRRRFGGKAQEAAHDNPNEDTEEREGEGGVTKWSWIGDRSPLMGGKTESEWLLDKLFERLQESLRDQMKGKEEGVKNETRKSGEDPKERQHARKSVEDARKSQEEGKRRESETDGSERTLNESKAGLKEEDGGNDEGRGGIKEEEDGDRMKREKKN